MKTILALLLALLMVGCATHKGSHGESASFVGQGTSLFVHYVPPEGGEIAVSCLRQRGTMDHIALMVIAAGYAAATPIMAPLAGLGAGVSLAVRGDAELPNPFAGLLDLPTCTETNFLDYPTPKDGTIHIYEDGDAIAVPIPERPKEE